MNKNLNELFSAPINLKPVYNTNGTIFYSSDKLKENFIIAFEKSSKGNHIVNEIKMLVEDGTIIPCYKSKNILSFIKNRIIKDENKMVVAFYSQDDKKVIVLIENESSILGTSSNNEIVSTTIHECMHLIADRNSLKFRKIFMPYLKEYYSSFFTDYLKLKNIDNKKIYEIIKYIGNFETNNYSYINSHLQDFYKLIEISFIENSNLTINEFKNRLNNLIVSIKILMVSVPTLIKNIRYFSMILTSLNIAYKKAFKETNEYTMPIQELITLSEVACVYSEMKPKDSVIKSLFKLA